MNWLNAAQQIDFQTKNERNCVESLESATLAPANNYLHKRKFRNDAWITTTLTNERKPVDPNETYGATCARNSTLFSRF